MRATFPKSSRLLRRAQFQDVQRQGKEVVGHFLCVRILSSKRSKLGLVVSRRFGGSVQRNRFKRLIRESYRHAARRWPTCHLVVSPRTAAKEGSLALLSAELAHLVAASGR